MALHADCFARYIIHETLQNSVRYRDFIPLSMLLLIWNWNAIKCCVYYIMQNYDWSRLFINCVYINL